MKQVLIIVLSIFCITAAAQVTLNSCIKNATFRVVILGSSTAAGSGPSHSDSAWVNKYRNTLQQINPLNEVINLAVGGYTTYRIMPDNFVTPSGRPAVNPLKNITQALSLNPDFIIVNLPSNDRNWPMAEQLNNFDSLYNHSWNNGVPMYICTTQPITSAGAYQRAVRDSIWAKFSPHVIEFFLPLADTNNLVQPQFAADAVHLTDAGHAVIVAEVINKDILAAVFEPSDFPDLAVTELVLPAQKCQDSTAQVGVVLTNVGDTALPGSVGYLRTDIGLQSDSVPIVLLNHIPPCMVDTIWVSANFSVIGQYNLVATLNLPTDSNVLNNKRSKDWYTVNNARVFAREDTVCKNSQVQFQLQNLQGDTAFWYANLNDSIPLQHVGNSFSLQKDTTFFLQAVSGRLDNWGKLTASTVSSTNYNGNMFNLYAAQTISLDSLELKIQSTGSVPVKIYTRSGKYQGFETDSSGWSLLVNDTVLVANAGDFVSISCNNTTLQAQDTVAFYVHLANSNQQLSYQSISQPVSKSTAELTYMSGAGAAYDFGTSYPNREIAANFYYTFGINYLGECASSRVEISKYISTRKVNIGADSTLPFSPTLISASSGFSNFTWVVLPQGDTISSSNFATIDSTLLQSAVATQVEIVCFADDKFGCQSTDTAVYTLLFDFSIAELDDDIKLNVFPNPAENELSLTAEKMMIRAELISMTGDILHQQEIKNHRAMLKIAGLPSGLYVLRIYFESGVAIQKIIKR